MARVNRHEWLFELGEKTARLFLLSAKVADRILGLDKR